MPRVKLTEVHGRRRGEDGGTAKLEVLNERNRTLRF